MCPCVWKYLPAASSNQAWQVQQTLWSCHTGLSLSNTWLQYISLFLFTPLKETYRVSPLFQMGVELTVNRPAFVSSGTTYLGFEFFFLQTKSAERLFSQSCSEKVTQVPFGLLRDIFFCEPMSWNGSGGVGVG